MMDALYKPNSVDMAQLLALTKQPGFDTLKKLMLSQIDRFQLDVMNVDPTDKDYKDKLSSAHYLAKAAALFYQSVMNRITNESQEFLAAQSGGEIQADITESLLT